MCRLLKVSVSGFYAWDDRPRSRHARRDLELTALIHTIHERSYGTYGAPRVHAELQQAYGVHVGRKRVARLMKAAGLRGISKRRFVCTTVSEVRERWAPDLVDRDFTVSEPDRLWVADATFIPTWEGFLYLAMVLDAFSRRVVGWAMGGALRTELMLSALERAYAQRTPRAVIIIRITAASTPRSPSESAARSSACVRRWARSVMPTTMRWQRASLRRWSARCWIATISERVRPLAMPFSSGSKAGTTPAGAIPRSATVRLAISNERTSVRTSPRTRRFWRATRARLNCARSIENENFKNDKTTGESSLDRSDHKLIPFHQSGSGPP